MQQFLRTKTILSFVLALSFVCVPTLALAQEDGEQQGPAPEQQQQYDPPTQPAPVDSSFGGSAEVGGGGGFSLFKPPAVEASGWRGGEAGFQQQGPELGQEPVQYKIQDTAYTEPDYIPFTQVAQQPTQPAPVDSSFGGNAEVAVGGGFSLFKEPQKETPELGQEPIQYEKYKPKQYSQEDYVPLNQAPAPQQQDGLNTNGPEVQKQQDVLATSKFLDANGVSPGSQKTILGGLYDFITGADTKDGPMVSNSGCKTPDGSACEVTSKAAGFSYTPLGNDYNSGVEAFKTNNWGDKDRTFIYGEQNGVGYWFDASNASANQKAAALKLEGFENIKGIVSPSAGEPKEVTFTPAGGGLQQIETYNVPGATADKLAPTLPSGFAADTSLEEGKKDLISRSAQGVYSAADNTWRPLPVDLNQRQALIDQLQAKGDVVVVRDGGAYNYASRAGVIVDPPPPLTPSAPPPPLSPPASPPALDGLEQRFIGDITDPKTRPSDPLYGVDGTVPAAARVPTVGGNPPSATPGSPVTGGGSTGAQPAYYVNLDRDGTGLVTLREGQAPPAGYTRVWSTGDGGFTPTPPTREGQGFAETALVNRIQASANAPVPVEPPGFFERAWNFITGRSSSAPAPTSQADSLTRSLTGSGTDVPQSAPAGASPAATQPQSARAAFWSFDWIKQNNVPKALQAPAPQKPSEGFIINGGIRIK